VQYRFEWDPAKAKANWRKHRVSFEDAAGLFLDPLAISVPDDEHSEAEERWVTMGRNRRGLILVIIHTLPESLVKERRIRIISARKATKREMRQYEES
jgi:uncharacterized DUF497 family protein